MVNDLPAFYSGEYVRVKSGYFEGQKATYLFSENGKARLQIKFCLVTLPISSLEPFCESSPSK